MPEVQEIYEKALRRWGHDAQIDMAIEEMAELIVALQHAKRARAPSLAVAEEIADVEIMLGQMRLLFSGREVDVAKAAKLGRLRMRLEHE